MQLALVEWRLLLPSLLVVCISYAGSLPLVRALGRRFCCELSDKALADAVCTLTGAVFSVVVIPAAVWGFITAPPDFAAPEALYRNFPHVSFVLWWAVAYFTCDFLACLLWLGDPMYTVHALFSGGGAVLAACAPRMQNMYCWLMVFSELSNLGLHTRKLMILFKLARRYPRVFQTVEYLFVLSFFLCRVVIMLPRYVRHAAHIRAELNSTIPGVRTPNSWLQAEADLIMNSLSVIFNIHWFLQMLRKLAARLGKRSSSNSDNTFEKDR